MKEIKEKRNRVGESNKWFLTIPSINSDTPGELGNGESAIRSVISTISSREGEGVKILLVVERGNNIGHTAEALSGSESINFSSENRNKVPISQKKVPENVHHLHIYVEYPEKKQLYNKHFDYLGKHGHLVPYVKLDTIESDFIKPGFKEIKEENYKKREKNAFFIMFQYLAKETKIVFTTIKTSERGLKLNKFIREKSVMLKNIEESKAIGRELASQNLKLGGFNKIRDAKREIEKSVRSLYLAQQLKDFDFFKAYFRETEVKIENEELRYLDRDPIFKEILMQCSIKGKIASRKVFFRELKQRSLKSILKERELKKKLYELGGEPTKVNEVIKLRSVLAAMRNSRWATYKSNEIRELFRREKDQYISEVKVQMGKIFEIVRRLLKYRIKRYKRNKVGNKNFSEIRIERDNNFIIYSRKRKVGKTTFLNTLSNSFSTFKMPTRTTNLTNWADWRDDIISWDELSFKTFKFNHLLQFLQGTELLVGGIDVPKKDYPIIIGTSNKDLEVLFKESYKKGNWEEDRASLDTRIKMIDLEVLSELGISINLFSISEFIERVFVCQIAIGIVTGGLKESKNEFIKELKTILYFMQDEEGGSEDETLNLKRKINFLEEVISILASSNSVKTKERKLEDLKEE